MKKVIKFHQFIALEKGPVNTCISNLLSGDIYSVPNMLVEQFNDGKYDNIPDFIASLKEEELVIEVNENTWIPTRNLSHSNDSAPIILQLEKGVELQQVYDFLLKNRLTVKEIQFYGDGDISHFFQGVQVKKMVKDFSLCHELSTVTEDFADIDEDSYFSSKEYNSCWGNKLAITKEGYCRPCIYSSLTIGNIEEEKGDELLKRAFQYRTITKEKVEKCKDCEFRWVCFDCREIAQRENNGDLYATNPTCNYNPCKGKWKYIDS